jgi:hypothetical protein
MKSAVGTASALGSASRSIADATRADGGTCTGDVVDTGPGLAGGSTDACCDGAGTDVSPCSTAEI